MEGELHGSPLIVTIVAALSFAFLFGFVAAKLRLPPIVGYLLAGIVVGPHTPGIIADAELAAELAEIGVILLMFGVGLHFSIADLMAVRRIAIPGALGQILLATLVGIVVGFLGGWDFGGGLVLGLALSVASTVVLLRALEQRNALTSVEGPRPDGRDRAAELEHRAKVKEAGSPLDRVRVEIPDPERSVLHEEQPALVHDHVGEVVRIKRDRPGRP